MSFRKTIAASLNEKDVENTYRSELLKLKNSSITSPFNVDGLLTNGNIQSLLEFKYDVDLKNKNIQVGILVQCLYYLKIFELNGQKIPSTIIVGDINECFVIHSNTLLKYLYYDIDWNIAPSMAYKSNDELIMVMMEDDSITPYIFDINEDFVIESIIVKLEDFSKNKANKIDVNKHNIVAAFAYFLEHVLKKSKLSTNEQANLFIQLIVKSSDNYIHPKKKNTLSTKAFGEIPIDSTSFKSFFSHYENDEYTPKKKEELTGLVDRLIDDTTRRSKGEFFTPALFVDLAHKYMSEVYGDKWKESFKEEFAAFRNAYKSFEDRLIPLVYELGFLKK